jgi:hypothetical protein
LDNNQQNRYLTTAKSIDPSQIPTNLALRTFDDNTSSYLANVNTLPTHPGGDAINGSSTATEADGPAYGGSALWGNNWGGSATFNSTARIGESMNFYLLANTSNSGSNALKANLTIFANDVGNASWSLAQDGTLTYMAPVPEPGEWALMLSGLALVGAPASQPRRAQLTKPSRASFHQEVPMGDVMLPNGVALPKERTNRIEVAVHPLLSGDSSCNSRRAPSRVRWPWPRPSC